MYVEFDKVFYFDNICLQQTMELLGETASDAMAGCLTAACRDLLIPAFDRSCQVLFNQVNQSFHAGTVECKIFGSRIFINSYFNVRYVGSITSIY